MKNKIAIDNNGVVQFFINEKYFYEHLQDLEIINFDWRHIEICHPGMYKYVNGELVINEVKNDNIE